MMSAPILRYFDTEHLSPALREIADPFRALAEHIDGSLLPGAETSTALRKLLEAKDAAVRAALD